PAIHMTVAQAVGKGDRFEQVIQHGTEAGASAFIPLMTERTVVRLTPGEAEAKRNRWRLVAKGAAEQSGRVRIPDIHDVESLPQLLERKRELGPLALLEPEGQALSPWLTEAGERGRAMIVVGPEGGFSPAEIDAGRAAGAAI